MNTAERTATTRATLERLPVELLLASFSFLPVRETYRLRRVSKKLKATIDEEENEEQIARPHIKYHQQRLQTSLTQLSDPNQDILDAFIHWITHYGEQADTDRNPWGSCLHVHNFVTHYDDLHRGRANANQLVRPGRAEQVISGLEAFWRCHKIVHDHRLLGIWKQQSRSRVVARKMVMQPLTHPTQLLGGAFPLVEDSSAKISTLMCDSSLFTPTPEGLNGQSDNLSIPRHQFDVETCLEIPAAHSRLFYTLRSSNMAPLVERASFGWRLLTPLQKAGLLSDLIII